MTRRDLRGTGKADKNGKHEYCLMHKVWDKYPTKGECPEIGAQETKNPAR